MIKIKKILFILLLVVASLNSSSATITDGLFITIGDKAVTISDIVKEIKLIIILNMGLLENNVFTELFKEVFTKIFAKKVLNLT